MLSPTEPSCEATRSNKMSWKCTGSDCGKCADNVHDNTIRINKLFLPYIQSWFELYHQYTNPIPFLVCKKCNRDTSITQYYEHLSQFHERTSRTSRFGINIGKIEGSKILYACIQTSDILNRFPQLVCLSIRPEERLDNIMDGVYVGVEKYATCRIDSIVIISENDEIFDIATNKIMQKMTVCADCGYYYECAPSIEVLRGHCSRHLSLRSIGATLAPSDST